MARIGFLSHADMSIHFFRRPIMQALKDMGHDVFAIAPKGNFTNDLAKSFHTVTYELDKASLNPLTVINNSKKLSQILGELNLDLLQTGAHKSMMILRQRPCVLSWRAFISSLLQKLMLASS